MRTCSTGGMPIRGDAAPGFCWISLNVCIDAAQTAAFGRWDGSAVWIPGLMVSGTGSPDGLYRGLGRRRFRRGSAETEGPKNAQGWVLA